MSQVRGDYEEAVQITIGEKFNRGTDKAKSLYSFARIYKVPEDLCKLNESAYIPRLVAIGPLHRKDTHLPKAMQDVKFAYANRLFLRLNRGTADSKTMDEKKDQVLQKCMEEMKNRRVRAKKYYQEEELTLLEKAKKYYAEELELRDDEMAEMLLVDGCFILELLYVSYHTNYCQEDSSKSSKICEQPRADPIFDNILTANTVKHDLMLLENQIPFFVLEYLFQLTVNQISGCPNGKLSLEVYVRSFFQEFLPNYSDSGSTKDTELRKTKSGPADDYYHILHLIHSRYIPEDRKEINKIGGSRPNSTLHSELTLSAIDLHYAGVEFVPIDELSDVKFVNQGVFCCCHTLEFQVPTISIRNATESFLRNVIALEQCSPGVPRYFTSYAKLMDMFINSEEDVRVLTKSEVIHNYLSTDKDVCDLFNKLCNEVVLEDFHFDEECQRASHYNMRWQTRVLRYVTRLFFASPWPVLAFCLGILTFMIAVYNFGCSINKRLHH